MFVPVVPNTIVVHKKIVYNDTVLSLSELGKSLIVTSVSEVSKSSLEDCLKEILRSNPNVVFDTIQYSLKDKKVYFYTNKEISTKEYEEIKTTKRVTSLILKDIKDVLKSDKVSDASSISVYDVSYLMGRKNKEYCKMIDFYETCINEELRLNDKNSQITVCDFYYKTNELKIAFKFINDEGYVRFSKEGNDLFITNSNFKYDKEVLFLVGYIISDLYDKFGEYREFFRQNKDNIKSVNSNFLVYIPHFGANIFVENKTNDPANNFSLFSYNMDDNYDLDCCSTQVANLLRGKKDELFKRIFVKIDDCPLWIQEDLYNFRLSQLESEEKEESVKRVLTK